MFAFLVGLGSGRMEHRCKLCNKTFSSGKVLGGHMRGHGTKNSAKAEKKLKVSNVDFEGDDDEHAGYGLRVNPKKSWKFSGSKVQASEKESLCKVCGKRFDSMKAMFGHMRHHSSRERKETQCCKDCGKAFDSLRALTAHTKIHSKRLRTSDGSQSISSEKLFVDFQYSTETMGLIRRKRSKRLRYKITPSSSFSGMNESKYASEFGQEVVDGAICLMIISRGGINWGRISSVTESSDNNSLSLEVQSPVQKNRIMGNRGGISVCNDTGNKIFEFGENDSGFASDEEKTGKLEVPIDRFYRGAECKRPKLDEDSAFAGYDAEIEKESHGEMEAILTEVTEVELDVDIIEEEELDVTKLGSMKSGMKACDSGNNMLYGTESEIFADSRKKREHKCRTCKKLFRSHQALGGHQRVHKATNNCSGEKIVDSEDKIQINKLSKIEYSCKLAKLECTDNSEEQEMERATVTGFESKVHRCSICLKVFATGQALGGHKRVHFGKDSETGTEQTRALKQRISEICDVFELSQPVKLEEENGDVEFKSWWLGNEHKRELLVGLMPN